MAMKWSEGKIAGLLARHLFKSDLCVLPNVLWTGDEIDLLVVTRNMRIIDIEIKISRADLKLDKDKDKWWKKSWGEYNRETGLWERLPATRTPREYPVKVWKHYYAMPESIWKPELLEHVQPISGVILLNEYGRPSCIKRAVPNRKATTIIPEHAIAIARLASLRMWDAYKKNEVLTEEIKALTPAAKI